MWIKVGSHLVNDALVSAVAFNTTRPGTEEKHLATVYLMGGGSLMFTGPDAHAVLDYFGKSAVPLSDTDPDTAAYMEFRASGGNLSRVAWSQRMARRRAIYDRAGDDMPRGPDYIELQKIERDLMV